MARVLNSGSALFGSSERVWELADEAETLTSFSQLSPESQQLVTAIEADQPRAIAEYKAALEKELAEGSQQPAPSPAVPAQGKTVEEFRRFLKEQGYTGDMSDAALQAALTQQGQKSWDPNQPRGDEANAGHFASSPGARASESPRQNQPLPPKVEGKEEISAKKEFEEKILQQPGHAFSAISASGKAPETIQNLFGREASHAELANLAGALEGSTVRVRKLGNKLRLTVNIPFQHEGKWYEAEGERTIYKDRDGKLVLHNDIFRVPDEAQGSGIGTQMVLNQIRQAAESGFSKVEFLAARNDHVNSRTGKPAFSGYKVWPKFGYDGYLWDSTKEKMPETRWVENEAASAAARKMAKIENRQSQLGYGMRYDNESPEDYSARLEEVRSNGAEYDRLRGEWRDGVTDEPTGYREANTIQELYALPGGREQWEQHGDSFNAEFDLSQGSKSWQVLAKYTDKIKQRKGTKSLQNKRSGCKIEYLEGEAQEVESEGIEADLSPEQTAALDAIWGTKVDAAPDTQ